MKRHSVVRITGTFIGVGVGYAILAVTGLGVLIGRAVALDRSMEEQELADELSNLRRVFGTEPTVS